MFHDTEKEREEDLLDWVVCALDIDESAMEDEQDGEWKTARISRKGKEKPVEENEIQEGEKKKMHTSKDGAECNEKKRSSDSLYPSRMNINSSFDRAYASTNVQSNSGKEKGEKVRVFKPNLGFNVTKTMRSEDSRVILVRPIGVEVCTFTTNPVALAQGIAAVMGVIKGIRRSVNMEDVKASAECGSSELLSVRRLPREGFFSRKQSIKLFIELPKVQTDFSIQV
ncbi:hypothetical protein FHG87_009402 [Trinorchestia longiramus]|nr:hypothetical protein FHG87_009402 [Trinorchestia longiramus]